MPSHEPSLPSGVELWSNHLDESALSSELLGMLSDDERSRAARFRFERDRIRFVARRAFARKVLARYVGVAPARIRIRTSSHGRPELDPPCGYSFNTSHSDGLAVVAVAHGRQVGVDIERVRPVTGAKDIARQFFAPAEADYLRSIPEGSYTRAFLTIWTRKESYAKAIGGGLSIPFDGFDVSTPDHVRSGRPRGSHGDIGYEFTSLDALDGYVGALTVSDAGARNLVGTSPVAPA